MSDNEYLLTLLLNCGPLDLPKMHEIINTLEDNTEESFDYMNEALENIKDMDVKVDFQSLAGTLLLILVDNLCGQYNHQKTDENTELEVNDFKISVNYRDTHCTYIGNNEKVKDWLGKHCDLIEM